MSPADRPRTPDNTRNRRTNDQPATRQQCDRQDFLRQQPPRSAEHEQYARRDGVTCVTVSP
jgi:hypothetical protein